MPTLDPPASGYSAESDFLLGNIPLPSWTSGQKYIADAQKEIDSVVGFMYETPLDLSNSSAIVRPARLLVSRISNYLASGRLIMAVAAGSEKDSMHAYGAKLVSDALEILEKIGCGEIVLTGAVPLPGQEKPFAGPQISNVDSESNVEAFYDRIGRRGLSVSFDDSERRLIR